MPQTIALDIVLLPPPEIWKWAIELSNQLNRDRQPLLQLDETHLPHITIVQSFVAVDRLDDLYKALEVIAQETPPLALEVTSMEVDDGTVGFIISHTPQLNHLFAKSMRASEIFVVEPDPTAFLLDAGESTLPGTMNWVKNFRTMSSYKPHISLSKNLEQIPAIELRAFIADRFAVCHLGNNCTCRAISKEWQLSK